jgi:hypothetical protein
VPLRPRATSSLRLAHDCRQRLRGPPRGITRKERSIRDRPEHTYDEEHAIRFERVLGSAGRPTRGEELRLLKNGAAAPLQGGVMRIPLSPTQAPALAIALLVRERGAAYSAEILNAFDISEPTPRRRRLKLRWLGIDFVPRGRGSFYSDSRLTRQFPTTWLPHHTVVPEPEPRPSRTGTLIPRPQVRVLPGPSTSAGDGRSRRSGPSGRPARARHPPPTPRRTSRRPVGPRAGGGS